jgi:hypothetical protein
MENAMNTSTQRGSSTESGKSQETGTKKGAAGDAGKVVQGVKDQAAKLGEGAKELVSQAGDKLLDSAEEQKAAGANFLAGMAGAVRRAANEFHDVPQAANYIRQAAEQMESVSDAFRRRDVSQLIADVQSFARRQPTAFLGVTVLAGFAAVRFLKSSMPRSDSQHTMTASSSRPPYSSATRRTM